MVATQELEDEEESEDKEANAEESSEEEEKHVNFISRMLNRGYTKKQVQLIVNWYIHYKKSNWDIINESCNHW